MKISVIVPIYNVEKYLRECIESIIAQSYKNMEILLINDGSTDNSEIICREYEEKYSFVRLINKENGGLSDARNVGIHNSTGDYIMFLDSDDYWEGDFLADLVKFIENNKQIEYVLFKYKYFYQQKNIFQDPNFVVKRKEIRGKNGLIFLNYALNNIKDFHWYAWSGVVKRSFLLKNNLFFKKGRNYEDVLWTPQVYLKAKCVDYYDKAIYVYRLEREGQITSTFSYKNLEDNIFVSTFWHKELQKNNIDKHLRLKLMKNFTTRYFVTIWFSGFLKNNEKNEIFTSLKDNNHLLRYDNSFIIKFTAILCRVIGFRYCSSFFKLIIKIKRRL